MTCANGHPEASIQKLEIRKSEAMEALILLQAVLLGIIEGATEFIPVSSTGHLLLIRDLIGFKGPEGFVFEIVIQLGAILAICWVYRERLFNAAFNLHKDKGSRMFAASIITAFLPAMIIGALAHDFIKRVLFVNLWLVCIMLIVGGIILLLVDKYLDKEPVVFEAEKVSLLRALGIGFFQVLAMVPGVSRSGATIVGGMLLGLDKKAAAEFSFFLAVPTMLAATVYDIYSNRHSLSLNGEIVIAVGFITAFLAAMAVVRTVIPFIQRSGYKWFAWYRIALGTGMLIAWYIM